MEEKKVVEIAKSELKKILTKARRCRWRHGFKVLWWLTRDGRLGAEIVTAASPMPTAWILFHGYVRCDPFLSYREVKDSIEAEVMLHGYKIAWK